MNKSILFFTIFLCFTTNYAQLSTTIKVQQGQLQGVKESGLTVFKGIPFAAPSDLVISDAMGTYWTNFAKYGDPNGIDMPKWPAFNVENGKVMYFEQKPYVSSVPSFESLKVLDQYFKWRRTPEGEVWAN